MRTFLASVALAVSVGISGTAHAADCAPLKIINSLKTEPLARSGLFTVPITLNGVDKRFLFDTGGGVDQITQATVEELKLPVKHAAFRTSGLYKNDSTDYVSVFDVVLGAQHGSTQFMVTANPNLPFAGVIAIDRLSRQDVDLDFGAQRVNYFSTDHCEGKVVYWPHQVLSVIPVTLEQGHIDVQVELDGHPLRATLDTGSTRTNLRLDRATEKLGFSPDTPPPPGTPKGNPERQIYPRRFSTLSFDGVTVANPLIIIQPLEFGGGKDDTAILASRAQRKDDLSNRLSPDMLIGMDILRHLHMYLAVNEEKLYVTEAGSGESVLFKTAGAAAPSSAVQ
jgi:hypothetical protein